MRSKQKLLSFLSLGIILAAIVTLNDLVAGDWSSITGGKSRLVEFIKEDLWPPDWSLLQARPYPVCESSIGFFCSKAFIGMFETMKMAFVATILGFLGAIILSPLAARNLVPKTIHLPIRIFMAATRSLPSLIWAVMFIAIFGLGPLAGVLAMTFYTIGYLGKFQYEEMEGMRSDPLEAARAMGLSKREIALFVVIPETSNSLLSQLLFMFEYNVRHGTVLGLVGAGGIGYYLSFYIGLFMYQQVMTFIIVIFVVVVLLDLLSMFIRSFVNEGDDVRRPSWKTIFQSPNEVLNQDKSNKE